MQFLDRSSPFSSHFESSPQSSYEWWPTLPGVWDFLQLLLCWLPFCCRALCYPATLWLIGGGWLEGSGGMSGTFNSRLLCLRLIDKRNQERKKKRTKDFLSPPLFPAHKTSHSQLWTISLLANFGRSANHIQLFWPPLIWVQQPGSGIQDQGFGSFHKLAAVGTSVIAALTNGKAGIKKNRRMHKWQALASPGIRAPPIQAFPPNSVPISPAMSMRDNELIGAINPCHKPPLQWLRFSAPS